MNNDLGIENRGALPTDQQNGVAQQKKALERKTPVELLCGLIKLRPALDANAQNQNAARYATLTAQSSGNDWTSMGGLGVCWDGVLYCAEQTGIVGRGQKSAKDDMVSLSDARVANSQALRQLDPGMVLGFFNERNTLGHVMITTGNNHAAGMKNSCIGIGDPFSWQELDLNALRWNNKGQVVAGNQSGHTTYTIRYRPISALSG